MSDAKTLTDALTPSLLKTVLSEALLAEIMTTALTFRGGLAAIEDLLYPGVYKITNHTTGIPQGAYSFAILIVAGSISHAQHIYIPVLDGGESGGNRNWLIRTVWDGKARSWRKLLNQFAE